MLYLTCGTPGSGKTLRTIWTVEKRRKDENRQVFYSGIRDLALDWIALEDPKTWNSLPAGSIIVIDECQGTFPNRKQSSQVPEYVSAFETHRHKGYDIFLITQSPQLIDIHVRKLVGEYCFLDRPFNQDYVVVYKFRHVVDWKNQTERQGAEKERWTYPKEAYKWYKSSEIHTHKKRLPKYLLWIPLFLVILTVSGYGLNSVFQKHASAKDKKLNQLVEAKSGTPSTVPSIQFATSGVLKEKKPMTKLEYLETLTPRIQELPYSAPMYDEITAKPTVIPKVAACIEGRGKCECWTQQATRLHIDDSFCRNYVKYGQFDPYLMVAGSPEPTQTNSGYSDTSQTLKTPLKPSSESGHLLKSNQNG